MEGQLLALVPAGLHPLHAAGIAGHQHRGWDLPGGKMQVILRPRLVGGSVGTTLGPVHRRLVGAAACPSVVLSSAGGYSLVAADAITPGSGSRVVRCFAMTGGGIELIDRAEAAARLPEFGDLLRMALAAQRRARAPYSKFSVGAAVLGGSGAAFPGANVESASYGATICAERSAIVGAIVAGETTIRACVVVTPTAEPSSPCGICRQLMAEFGPDVLVFAASSVGDSVYAARLGDLLPLTFGPGESRRSALAGGDRMSAPAGEGGDVGRRFRPRSRDPAGGPARPPGAPGSGRSGADRDPAGSRSGTRLGPWGRGRRPRPGDRGPVRGPAGMARRDCSGPRREAPLRPSIGRAGGRPAGPLPPIRGSFGRVRSAAGAPDGRAGSPNRRAHERRRRRQSRVRRGHSDGHRRPPESDRLARRSSGQTRRRSARVSRT